MAPAAQCREVAAARFSHEIGSGVARPTASAARPFAAGSCGGSWRSRCRPCWWSGRVRGFDPPQSPRTAGERRDAWLDAHGTARPMTRRATPRAFAPQLARAYGKALRSIAAQAALSNPSVPVVVRRLLQDGDTAVLELHQKRPRDGHHPERGLQAGGRRSAPGKPMR